MRRGLALATAVLALTACGSAGAEDTTTREGPLSGQVTVFAAASLTDVFEKLAGDFTDDHPDVELAISYGGSSGLAQGILDGAPVDVFASANEEQMAVVTDAGLAAEAEVFTSNVLQIAVPAGNPGGVTGLVDLAREELTVALCAREVPCGAAAEEVLGAAGVTAAPDTMEEDVRAALTKVELGEVDAALVYASDVVSAGEDVEGLAFPEAEDAVNDYPICVLDDAPNPEAARAFVDLVLSAEGQRALADAGFRTP